MECRLCGHPSTHKHGKAPNGSQRYFCPDCKQTFNERFDTMSYHRQVTPEQIRQVLKAHIEGSSLRGISRTSGLAYNTVVSIVRTAKQAQKACSICFSGLILLQINFSSVEQPYEIIGVNLFPGG